MLAAMANMAATRFRALAFAVLGTVVGGCVELVGAERIVGPDGTRMLHVHCGDEQVACFQLAGELCPRGYFLSPIFDPHDGNFLVRCKDPTQVDLVASAAPSISAQPLHTAQPASPSGVHPAAPEQSWPPTEVAKPSEPWPAPSAGTPLPHTAISDVDIGY